MDVEIIDEDENPMLHRTDVRFQLAHEEATPSRLSVRDSLAAKLNKDASEVVVHTLDTKYGMRKSVGYAKVYETSEDALEVEQEYVLQRNKISADGEVQTAEDVEPEVDEDEAEPEVDEETEEDAEAEDEDEEAADDEADSDEDEEAEEEAEEAADADEDEGAEAEADEEAADETEEADEGDEAEAEGDEDSEDEDEDAEEEA